jgi:predicted nucleotidyltransferase
VYKHHSESIKVITEKFKKRKDVRAVILVGTIAQGFDNKFSDIDLLIVVSEKDFKTRKDNYDLKMIDKESAVYEGGYIDAKYISLRYIKQVALKGSDAARYAFRDAKILYSRINDLQDIINTAVRYPIEHKNKRINEFCSQMMAWCWYACEGIRDNNRYLMSCAVPNVVLFAGRAILAYNEMLYPYHKWFMKVLEDAPLRPDDMIVLINGLLTDPSKGGVICFRDYILDYVGVDKRDLKWTDSFVIHNEMNWLYMDTPIADI